MSFSVDDSSFQITMQRINENAKRNTMMFAQSAANEFQRSAQGGAPWVNRRGVARARLYGRASATGTGAAIEIGGSAPNYKPYKNARKRYPDYMELLEFAHGGRYAIVFPLREELVKEIQQKFGEAALHGTGRVKIARSKSAMNERKKDFRARGGR